MTALALMVLVVPQAAWCESTIEPALRAALVTAEQTSPDFVRQLARSNYNAAALTVTDGNQSQDGVAARRVLEGGLGLYYWIEIGRNPALANAHPEWMASLQGHPEWHRYFTNLPPAKTNEVVKNYPWVPMLYQETFAAHLERVRRLLVELPRPKGVFLNDLQGAPSACGCGNSLCRWTTDYGPIRTATRLPNDAAARFVASVKSLAPNASVIPVWTTECEEHDKQGRCAGVGCFEGTCWREYTAQLMPLAQEAGGLAVLLTYRDFQRDLPEYGPKAGWIQHALDSFTQMPPKRNGSAIPPGRLLAVLEGWDTTPEEINAQITRTQEAGAGGYVVALTKIEQGWEPRIISVNAPVK